MFTGIIIIAAIVFMAAVSYRRPKLEQKVIKNIPLIDWIYLLVIPISLFISIILIVKNIISRPRIDILDFSDVQFFTLGLLFLIYAFVGASIHFVSKTLSRYLPQNHKSKAYQVNEIFHGKLSHYLVYICSFILVFILTLFEMNYPYVNRLGSFQIIGLALFGILLGISVKRSIFYTSSWFGGYNKPLFFLTVFLTIMIFIVMKWYGISLIAYPFILFMISASLSIIFSFIITQLMIVSRLSKKRKIRYLMKILSG